MTVAAMKAALIRAVGEVGDVAEPSGETIQVLAAPINPIDLAVSREVLATGHPELPYLPGCEAAGRTADGRDEGAMARDHPDPPIPAACCCGNAAGLSPSAVGWIEPMAADVEEWIPGGTMAAARLPRRDGEASRHPPHTLTVG
jgi:hypothetical protein